MADILEEILQDHKEIKALHFFKKFLKIIVVFAIITAACLYYYDHKQQQKQKNNQKAGGILLQTLLNYRDQPTKSLEFLSSIKEIDSRVADIAALQEVSVILGQKNSTDARRKLEEIVKNNKYSDITKSYARIILVSLVLNNKDLSPEEYDSCQHYLSHFQNHNNVSYGQVFFGTAKLLKAILEIKQKNYSSAEQALQAIFAAQQNIIATQRKNNNLVKTAIPQVILDNANALMLNLDMYKNDN